MTIAYEPTDFNELTVLFRWKGTIFPRVLLRPAIWFLLSAHIGFYYLHMYRHDVEMPTLAWKLVLVPTSLLTFFLVFYSGNCFSRYYGFYNKCMGMSGCVMAWTGLLRVHFPSADAQTLFNLSRYMVASVYLLYFQLGGSASDGGKNVVESEWQVLIQTGLIGGDEADRLKAYKGFRPFLLQVWALNCLKARLASDDKKAPGAALGPFQAEALKLRGFTSDIVDQLSQPVPFPYYHTLTLMLSLNLFLMAYSMIEFETIMTIPCFFIVCMVCLGLKETAVALADPFGGDDVDFETELYMANMLSSTMAIISPSADFPGVTLPLVSGHKALEAARGK